MTIELIPIAYAATSSAEIVEAVNNAFVAQVNSSYEFFWYVAGIFAAVLALTFIWNGGANILSLFGITKGRKY